MNSLFARSNNRCELCGSDSNLGAVPVDSDIEGDPETSVLLCDTCTSQIESDEALAGAHWYCLQESIWSEVPAVQILSYRLLHRLDGQAWAADTLEQAYLEEDNLAWAKRGLETASDEGLTPFDSNGAALFEGDSVTLIKDLPVKGANFTAKRGTLVKNIHIGNDPTHVEGKVNKTSIMLKTCFLKRVSS